MDKFSGPLFIVGMSRSGTKLIRELLNQHPDVGIPVHETKFIPKFIQSTRPQLTDKKESFIKFYKFYSNTNFAKNMQKEGQKLISKEEVWRAWKSGSRKRVLEKICRYHAPEDVGNQFIWGDKSPKYVNNLLTLKSDFLEAKFLHIIRDPRDRCLSVKKTWGRSLYRSAQRWSDIMRKVHIKKKYLRDDYCEIKYSDLLQKTEDIMKEVSRFLHIEFKERTLRLDNSIENYGSTKKENKIVKDNVKKYKRQLSTQDIKRIEEIVCPVMEKMGFHMENDVSYRPLQEWELLLLKVYDYISVITFHIKDKGILYGLDYIFGEIKYKK